MKEPIVDKVGKKLKRGQFVVYASASYGPKLRFGIIVRVREIKQPNAYNSYKTMVDVVSSDDGYKNRVNLDWYDRFLVISKNLVPKTDLTVLKEVLKDPKLSYA